MVLFSVDVHVPTKHDLGVESYPISKVVSNEMHIELKGYYAGKKCYNMGD